MDKDPLEHVPHIDEAALAPTNRPRLEPLRQTLRHLLESNGLASRQVIAIGLGGIFVPTLIDQVNVETDEAKRKALFNQGMDLLDEIDGVQQIGFDRARCRSAHIHAGNSTGLGKNYGTSGRPLRAGHLADFDTRHVGDAAAGIGHDPADGLVRIALRADGKGSGKGKNCQKRLRHIQVPLWRGAC